MFVFVPKSCLFDFFLLRFFKSYREIDTVQCKNPFIVTESDRICEVSLLPIERSRRSPLNASDAHTLVQVSLFRNNRLVEDGLVFYSVTSHGQLGAARACTRHVCCSRLGLLASSSPTLENT